MIALWHHKDTIFSHTFQYFVIKHNFSSRKLGSTGLDNPHFYVIQFSFHFSDFKILFVKTCAVHASFLK